MVEVASTATQGNKFVGGQYKLDLLCDDARHSGTAQKIQKMK